MLLLPEANMAERHARRKSAEREAFSLLHDGRGAEERRWPDRFADLRHARCQAEGQVAPCNGHLGRWRISSMMTAT
jgi:hypothetical protein